MTLLFLSLPLPSPPLPSPPLPSPSSSTSILLLLLLLLLLLVPTTFRAFNVLECLRMTIHALPTSLPLQKPIHMGNRQDRVAQSTYLISTADCHRVVLVYLFKGGPNLRPKLRSINV